MRGRFFLAQLPQGWLLSAARLLSVEWHRLRRLIQERAASGYPDLTARVSLSPTRCAMAALPDTTSASICQHLAGTRQGARQGQLANTMPDLTPKHRTTPRPPIRIGRFKSADTETVVRRTGNSGTSDAHWLDAQWVRRSAVPLAYRPTGAAPGSCALHRDPVSSRRHAF